MQATSSKDALAIDLKRGGVYMIRNNQNGRVYVGRAVNIQKRWTQHRHHLRAGTHHNKPLQNAWNKYGESAFAFTPLAPNIDCEDELCRLEQHYIDLHKCTDREYGYNLSPSARSNRGTKYTDESRARMSQAQKGRTFTDEARAQIAATLTGRKASPEAVAKRAAKLRGLTRTAEQRKAQSVAEHERHGSLKLRAFGKAQYLADWAREYGVNKGTLSNRLNRAGMSLEDALTKPNHRGARRDLHA